MNKILDWLRSHTLIKISALEKACGIPSNCIHRALRGLEDVPDKYLSSLQKELKKYGFKPK